jgi:hypothetical protein
MPKPNATELLERLTPRVLAAADRHRADRDLRAAADLLATVPAPAASDDPDDHYARLAASLHELADRFAGLAGRDLPRPVCFDVTVMPTPHQATDDVITAAVNAVGQALLGKDGKENLMSDKRHIHFGTEGHLGTIKINVFQSLQRKQRRPNAKDEEIARLRAELAEARAAGKEFPTAAPVRPQPGSPATVDDVDVTKLPPLLTPGPLTDPALVDSHADADIVNRYTGGAR